MFVLQLVNTGVTPSFDANTSGSKPFVVAETLFEIKLQEVTEAVFDALRLLVRIQPENDAILDRYCRVDDIKSVYIISTLAHVSSV
ncbi:hypothetical protein TRFO_33623 [Tritrichomonas foetus]|uniref:Uncharacterized protein n=1 Tax=Tritrichomonas foetus TaxID=1144522 RepID=A0A1J4JMB1_9EUKA|nr:hypothetical protein TRFO_33623 [Tritrichomonas foetus]|eukprot:OHS99833.1 hypothetical protein TRFO_33623 [Tritrichomonas foetus]